MRRVAERGPLAALGALLAFYLAIPLGAFVWRLGVSRVRGFLSPGLFPAFGVSLATATISLALVATCGLPLAYLLARHRGRIARVVGLVVQLPLALPPVMSGILLVYLVGPNTVLGRHLPSLTDSLAGIVLAQSFVAAPFLLVAARAAFAAVDQGHLDVARTLGHGEISRFLRVAVPEAAPGLRAGMLLCWLRAFGEYGATVILAYHPFSVPIYTFNQFSIAGLPTTQAPTALALGAAAVAVGVSRAPLGRLARRLVPRTAEGGEPPAPDGPRTIAVRACAPEPLSFSVELSAGAFSLQARHDGGGRLAVVGPSGAGKSTLLAALAGVRGAEGVELRLGADLVSGRPAEARRVGYLPQSFSLFPHLRVAEQVLFGVGAEARLAAQWCARLGVAGLDDRLPGELSGGERQRVGLAQALARAPALLLLDEPFAALDVPVRRDLRRALRALQRTSGVSSVIVTHDPEEAALLGDEIIVLAQGRVLQSGSVAAVFDFPASATVAKLLGVENFGSARVAGPGALALGGCVLPADTGGLAPGSVVHWSVPPEAVRVGPPDTSGAAPGVVEDCAELGGTVGVSVGLGGGVSVLARQHRVAGLGIGAPCGVVIEDGALRVWPETAPAGGGGG